MKKSFLALWLVALFPLVLLIGGLYYCYGTSGNFTLARIQSKLPFCSDWEVSSSVEEVSSLLSQPFDYIGNGAQSFVFLSRDGKYVLKFFKMHRLTPRKWLPFVPSSARRQKRLGKTFLSCAIAFQELKEETGMLCLHLNKTKGLYPTVQLKDRYGREWEADLNTIPFALQKRGELVYSVLSTLLDKGDLAGARATIRSLLTFIAKRGDKGIFDADQGVRSNYGFIGHTPVQIDIGGLYYSSTQDSETEVERVKSKIQTWLQESYPEINLAL